MSSGSKCSDNLFGPHPLLWELHLRPDLAPFLSYRVCGLGLASLLGLLQTCLTPLDLAGDLD